MNVSVLEHHLITSSVTGYTISKPPGFIYTAGQFINVEIPVKQMDNRGNKRNSSIVSAPFEENLMVAMRHGVSSFKQIFEHIPIGTIVNIAGPFGHFTLANDTNPVVLISGGIGITPLFAMIKDATHKKLPKPTTLLYSSKTLNDIPFMAKLKEYKLENPYLKLVVTLTQEPEDGVWQGKRGRINASLIKEAAPDLVNTTFYVCGPVGMVMSLKKILSDLGVPFEHLKAELFTGYA